MPCEMLACAESNVLLPKKLQKGEIAIIRPFGWNWGTKEGLPGFVQIAVSDAEVSEVKTYLSSIRDILQWERVASNANGRRYRVYIHPKVLAIKAGLRSRFRTYLENNYSAVLHSADLANGEATFDIPNTDWQAMRDQITYDVSRKIANRRYRINSNAVDAVVTAGGRSTATKNQLLNNITDRLA